VKAIFHREINIRLGSVCWHIRAGNQPQTFPRRVIEAAVAKGAATIVAPRRTFPGPLPDPSGDEPIHRRD
jgi:hypothetical protein